jgi:hypothetical protein
VNPDYVELLREFVAAEVRFLIVGAYAVALHSRPRATGDLDIWIEPTRENAERAWRALAAFGAPLADLSVSDLTTPDIVYQIGVAPRRIDILTTITGLEFDSAWPGRASGRIGDIECPFIGREALVRNKRALGRPRDLADLELLGETPE